jgi:hypothetical protein
VAAAFTAAVLGRAVRDATNGRWLLTDAGMTSSPCRHAPRGAVDSDRPELANIRRGAGTANRAYDLGSLAALFTERWPSAVGRCDVTLAEIARAEELGAEILQWMSPARREAIDDVRSLRHRAAEHLRRGIEAIREAAGYVFRNDPRQLERYPSLFVRSRRKASGARTAAADGPGPSVTTPAEPFASSEPSVEPLREPA